MGLRVTATPTMLSQGSKSKSQLPTPVKYEVIARISSGYPNETERQELIQGFQFGFKLRYQGPRHPVICKNQKSFLARPAVGMEKVFKEIQAGRVAGPFKHPPFPDLHCSPLGLVPKAQPNQFRLIHNLSSPLGNSINHFIPSYESKVQFAKFDDAIKIAKKLGVGTLIAKTDIQSAFRLLPIHPSDYPLLGFMIKDSYYFDRCLPMGCSISCALFEKFSRLLHWVVCVRSGLDSVVHYIDDYALLGRPNTMEAQTLLETFQSLCQEVGVPLAQDKTVLPTTKITFLGLEIDTVAQKIRVPHDKQSQALRKLDMVSKQKKVTLRVMQSLIGSLNFLCRAIPPGRAFLRRLVDSTTGIPPKAKNFRVRITREVRLDLQVWQQFLTEFNGTAMFLDADWVSNKTLALFTDAAGGIGFGMYFQGHWAQHKWPVSYKSRSIAFLELFPIMVACVIWGAYFTSRRIVFYTDNAAVAEIVNKKSSKCKDIMILVRHLVLTSLKHHFHFRAQYIAGQLNNVADSLSRFQNQRFRALCPNADPDQTPIPEYLLKL